MTYPLVKCGETKVRGAVVFIGEPLLRTAEITNRHTITLDFWSEGDPSKCIPKRLLKRIQEMEQEKTAVKEILQVLGAKK